MVRGLHIFLFCLAAAMSSCKDDFYDNSPGGQLKLSTSTITFGLDAGAASVGVTATKGAWDVTGWESWCEPDIKNGEKGLTLVTIVLMDNNTAAERTATLVFSSAGSEKELVVTQLPTKLTMPNINPDHEVNEQIKEQIIDPWYYWNGEAKNTPADYNQGYRRFFQNYLQYMTENSLDGGVWSTRTERYLYSRIERNPLGTDAAGLPPLNYGMEFDLSNYNCQGVNLNARILYVVPGGPADLAGLKRGDWFNKVNGVAIQNYATNTPGLWQYNRTIDTLVNPVAGAVQRLDMQRINQSTQGLDNNGTKTISPANFKGTPILHTSVLERTGVNSERVEIGYIVYTAFDPDYRNDLVSAFDVFRDSMVTHMVLDLRYNRSGTAQMAETMGNLLVPETVTDVFARYEFNPDQSANDKTVNFAPDPAHGVGVDTVFVLTSPFTAGAAELLINALAGIEPQIKLVVIGGNTEGLYAGMVKRTYSDTNYEYTAHLLAFRCYNAKDIGNYGYGFSPNGTRVDEWSTTRDNSAGGETGVQKWRDYWGWRGVSSQDPMLEAAVNYATGSTAMPTSPVKYISTSSQKTGYPRKFSVPATMTME